MNKIVKTLLITVGIMVAIIWYCFYAFIVVQITLNGIDILSRGVTLSVFTVSTVISISPFIYSYVSKKIG